MRSKMFLGKATLILLLTIAFALAGCSSSEDYDWEEAAVYAAFVDEHFAKFDHSSDPQKQHIIRDQTSGFQTFNGCQEIISELSPKPNSDTVRDFLARNYSYFPIFPLTEKSRRAIGRYPLNSHIKFKLPHVLMSDSMHDDIFDDEKSIDEGWDLFYQRYTHAHGMVELSRVGFNKDRSQALLYVDNVYSSEGGEGFFVLLEKKDNQWREVATKACWIS